MTVEDEGANLEYKRDKGYISYCYESLNMLVIFLYVHSEYELVLAVYV